MLGAFSDVTIGLPPFLLNNLVVTGWFGSHFLILLFLPLFSSFFLNILPFVCCILAVLLITILILSSTLVSLIASIYSVIPWRSCPLRFYLFYFPGFALIEPIIVSGCGLLGMLVL